jgi:hypothetical protein
MSRLTLIKNARAKQASVWPVRVLQRKCACGNHSVAGGACEACGGKVQSLQRRSGEHVKPDSVWPIVHDALNSSGRPLDASVRTVFEPRFGYDFSGVRVHTGASASASARLVNASAYTVGQNIVFGETRYTPTTATGARLLAHELAHTIQQRGAASLQSASLPISHPGDASERDADRAADTALAGRSTALPSAEPLAIQRQLHDDTKRARPKDPPSKEDFKSSFLGLTDKEMGQDPHSLDTDRPEWKAVQPVHTEGNSAADRVCETLVDPGVDRLPLSSKIKAALKRIARGQVASRTAKGVAATARALGVKDQNAQTIIENLIKAAIKAKQ